MSARAGDAVTLRDGDTRYMVEPFPAADQFCIPVLKLTDEGTRTDRLLVLAEDVHPAGHDKRTTDALVSLSGHEPASRCKAPLIHPSA